MPLKKPKLSIITINYNNGNGLEETISSVINQSYDQIEYIVIDGGSTDGSLSVINTYKDKFYKWVSEKDNGIYHAMNKGIGLANGSYLLFLNSGDKLINNDIIKDVFDLGYDQDILFGDLLFFDKNKEWIWHLEDEISFDTFYRSTIPHPSTFIKRYLFEKFGNYDENLKIVADWKFFMIVIARHYASFKHINKVISAYSFDGISSKPENLTAIDAERLLVLQNEFPFFMKDYKELNFIKAEMKKINYFTKTRMLVKKLLMQR